MLTKMNRSLIIATLLTALVLLVGATAHADSVTFTGGYSGNPILEISDPSLGSVYGYIDPYTGTIGGQTVNLWCVDPDHDAPPVGFTWTVNVATPGNLSSMSNTLQYLKGYGSDAAVAQLYGALASLILAMENPSNSALADQELQGAIWQLSDPSLTFPNPPSSDFLTQVAKDESTALSNPLTSGFEVLTDVNEKSNLTGAYQEFIVMTPEPSTLLLMGLGLISLFCFSRRKAISAGLAS